MGKFGGGNPGCGRKTALEENTMYKALNYGWEHLIKRFEDPKTTDKEKTDIALRICPKTVPQTVAADVTSGGETITPLLVKFIDGNSNNQNTGGVSQTV